MDDKMSEAMGDLEMVRKCAEVMQVELCERHSHDWPHYFDAARGEWGEDVRYDPLTNDAQAMELVKKFDLEIRRPHSDEWWVMGNGLYGASVGDADLNRAIVRCVAAMFGENDER